MSECYVGEIRLLPYMRGAPEGWHVCDGSLLPIAEYDALFALLGTTYGGNGQQTFGIPDLRSRVPVHQGTGPGLSNRPIGMTAGEESVQLTSLQMGPHVHTPMASTAVATSNSPAGAVLAALPANPAETFYNPQPGDGAPVAFPQTTLGVAGGSQPHDNTAPTLALQYCIALLGYYPSPPS